MRLLLFGLTGLLLSACAPRLAPSFDPRTQPSATDFGPHGDLMEWWYVSSYLPDQKLAFHWAQFKLELPQYPLPFLVSHVAVTDLNTGKVQFIEHNPSLSSGKISYPPLKINDGTWTFQQSETAFDLQAGPLALKLTPQKPPVIHPPGYSGVPETTGAMYYQSITRLALTGNINHQPVAGTAWLDHQWGNMAAGRKASWDWISLHLADGEDLMLYRVRTPDGKIVQTFGSIVDQQGIAHAAGNLQMQPGRVWTSPSERSYVLTWHVWAEEFDLKVSAIHDSQELLSQSSNVAYWEGPIEAQGTWRGQPASGTGMMELVSGSLNH